MRRLFLFLLSFCSNICYYYGSIEECCTTQPSPSHLQKEELIFRRRWNPQGPVLHQINLQCNCCLPSSAFTTLKLSPRLPHELQFQVRRDTRWSQWVTQVRGYCLGRNRENIAWFCCAYSFVVKGPPSPIYGLLYCVLTVLLHLLGAYSG